MELNSTSRLTIRSITIIAAILTAAVVASVSLARAGAVRLSTSTPPTEPQKVIGASYFPNVELTDQNGEKKHFFDDMVAGKVVLINFVYTTCKLSCPLETARLKKVYELVKDRMGKDIFFYSISIDPENDTPEVLKSYRQRYKIGEGWDFYTGDEESVTLLQKKLGLFVDQLSNANKDAKEGHSLNLIVGNQATGKWIKRSHLENSQILATILQQLHTSQEQPLSLASYGQAPVKLENVSPGEKLFYSRCADCHTIGQGDTIGPDLKGIAQRRDATWLRRWIKEPDVMLAERDTIAQEMLARYSGINMPNLKLTENDVEQVLKFIDSESSSAALNK
jgi:cytochrome oxidase Cu insertion factor (SCO1/SenC/PrrC family)